MTGRHVNESMPKWVVSRILDETGSVSGKKIHLMGIAYRPGVKESASSPVFPLYGLLVAEGAEVTASDPLFEHEEVMNLGLKPGTWSDAEIVVLLTDHLEYRSIDWRSEELVLFVDGRNAYEPEAFLARGIGYLGIGR